MCLPIEIFLSHKLIFSPILPLVICEFSSLKFLGGGHIINYCRPFREDSRITIIHSFIERDAAILSRWIHSGIEYRLRSCVVCQRNHLSFDSILGREHSLFLPIQLTVHLHLKRA